MQTITTTTNIAVSPAGALLLARLLRPRVQQLADLLEAQVEALEPGSDQWCTTADELATASETLNACENACLEAGA